MATNLINKLPHYTKYKASPYKFRYRIRWCSSQTKPNELNFKSYDEYCADRAREVSITLGSGQPLKINTGNMAKLADGMATVTLGNTTVMATAVSKSGSVPVASFAPLSVTYRQKAAALGRIPLTIRRRELGQNDDEILISRMVDRSIRPLFPKGFSWETQIICNPLALDGNNFPDVLSINAASAALAVSDIPWDGPVGAVRLALKNDEILLNPTKKDLAQSPLNAVVVSRSTKFVVMIEVSNSKVLLPEFLKILKIGVKESSAVARAIEGLMKECGKTKREYQYPEVEKNLLDFLNDLCRNKLLDIFTDSSLDKMSRDLKVTELRNNVNEAVLKEYECDPVVLSELFHNVCEEVFREVVLKAKIRCDGRQLDEIREITCKTNVYEPLHGSAIFQRGQTQVFCTVALDSPSSVMKMDRISSLTSGLKEKNFFVHYEFPPFATNEISRVGMLGRREVGHGALAEKGLKAVVPKNFPFTIRLTSEVLESNGSSSMATICGGSLALMDAGVPIDCHCAGVAMGVITNKILQNQEDDDYVILTDILGIEDHFGDTDFKVSGTKKFITAIQMDVKNGGFPFRVITKVLEQAKGALSNILKLMYTVCPAPKNRKDNWPVIHKVNISPQLRLKFIGPGGVNLKKMEMEVGVEFVEESFGDYTIFAPNKPALDEALEIIDEFIKSNVEPTLEFGSVYTASIVEIREYGCMVTLFPNMPPALIHLSQLDQRKVNHPSALGLQVGQQIEVKYFGRDPVSGSIRLSRKVLQSLASQKVISLHDKVSEESETTTTENKDKTQNTEV